MVILKDNHIDFAGGITAAVEQTKVYLEAKGKRIPIEVEVRSLDDVREVLRLDGVDRIMLDNFTPALTREAVELIAGRCEVESSGGITLDNLREYAACGVDFISVGALTPPDQESGPEPESLLSDRRRPNLHNIMKIPCGIY